MSNKSSLRWTEEQIRNNPNIQVLGEVRKSGVVVPVKPPVEKKSKYHNEKVVFHNIKFDSKKEANRYAELLLLRQSGEVSKIELQPRFDYEIHYQRPAKEIHFGGSLVKTAFYKADFRVFYRDGRVEVEDVKGTSTAIFRRKQKIIEKLYGIEILIK
jgi:hypothetical protein